MLLLLSSSESALFITFCMHLQGHLSSQSLVKSSTNPQQHHQHANPTHPLHANDIAHHLLRLRGPLQPPLAHLDPTSAPVHQVSQMHLQHLLSRNPCPRSAADTATGVASGRRRLDLTGGRAHRPHLEPLSTSRSPLCTCWLALVVQSNDRYFTDKMVTDLANTRYHQGRSFWSRSLDEGNCPVARSLCDYASTRSQSVTHMAISTQY